MRYCQKEGIAHFLFVAVDLAVQCFPTLKALSFEVMGDPETGERWLAISADIEGTVNTAMEANDEYTKRWLSQVPWPERNKIRLTFNII